MSLQANQQGADSQAEFEAWLVAAETGSVDAQGKLIEACRQYLLTIANQELPVELRGKVAPSDLVQDSCLEAQQSFSQFHGRTRAELLAWIRGILLFNVSNARRTFNTDKRRIDLEVPLDCAQAETAESPRGRAQRSPSDEAINNEEQQHIQDALQRLPEHLREAVTLRQIEHLSFAEIGERMGRTSEAVRKLWTRGLLQLQQELKGIRDEE